MSDPCIRVHLICIQWRELLYFIQYFCVCFFWGGGWQFYVNEVCHVARFGISAWNSFHEFIFPYPSTPIFFVIQLSFPLSSKIQLCNSACNSPKLMSLCFCICSYLFLVIAKDQTCLYLPGKTLSSEVGQDGFAELPLSCGSAID